MGKKKRNQPKREYVRIIAFETHPLFSHYVFHTRLRELYQYLVDGDYPIQGAVRCDGLDQILVYSAEWSGTHIKKAGTDHDLCIGITGNDLGEYVDFLGRYKPPYFAVTDQKSLEELEAAFQAKGWTTRVIEPRATPAQQTR